MIITFTAGISDGGRYLNPLNPSVALLASSMCAMDVFLGVEKMGGFHTIRVGRIHMRPKSWNHPKQLGFLWMEMVISNHFPSKGLESSNLNNQIAKQIWPASSNGGHVVSPEKVTAVGPNEPTTWRTCMGPDVWNKLVLSSFDIFRGVWCFQFMILRIDQEMIVDWELVRVSHMCDYRLYSLEEENWHRTAQSFRKILHFWSNEL